ncbi:MAG: hypothetical protein ACRD6I_18405 [Candidatus Acidiferrales bacterium]
MPVYVDSIEQDLEHGRLRSNTLNVDAIALASEQQAECIPRFMLSTSR